MLSFVNVCPVRSIHIQGIIITLFFQCLNALLNPVNRPGTGIKWSFVAHTIAMFSFVTVIIVMCLGVLPVCYIDNREFPGGYFPVPGPLGYYASLYSNPIDIVPKVMFLLNYCLADGLLVSAISNQPLGCLMRATPQLYRCYIIYGKNYWVIAFPCLMYITSCGTCSRLRKPSVALWAHVTNVGVGIAFIYQVSQRTYFAKSFAADVGIPYFSTSAALNVLLTLMIAVRLILHSRKTQSAMGAPARVNALYKTIVAMLVESCALYTVSSLLFIIPWAARSWVTDLFSPILTQIQVRDVIA